MTITESASIQPVPASEPASMPLGFGTLKPSSVRAYDKAIQHFRTVFKGAVPCDRAALDRYVASMRKNAPSTIYLRLQALRHEHARVGVPSPTDSPEVRALMRQLQRGVIPAKIDRSGRVRTPPKQKESRQARPLTRALLARMLDAMGANPLDRRDRCLLLLGFGAALSRSTLIALDLGDVSFTNDAMLLAVRESVRDPSNGAERRRVIAVPRTGHELCAARATSEWIHHAQLDGQDGPLIRRFDRAGNPTPYRLEAAYLGAVMKRRIKAVGVDPAPFSSLSLKRGKRAEVVRGLL